MQKKYKTKLVLFDLDGTLIDTAPDFHNAINKILITFQEVEQSIENSISLKNQLISIQDAVNSSESAYNLAVNRYETGLTNLITVLDSQQRWFDARQQKNIIEYQLLNSKINLFLALGGVFSDESKEEN